MKEKSSFNFMGCFVFVFAAAAFGFLILGARTEPPGRQNPLYPEPDLAVVGNNNSTQFVHGYANW